MYKRIDKKNTLCRRSKYGFTLLETVLAVALLLIITIFIYQGFMSTLHYSTNTAIYERSGQANERTVKSVLHDGLWMDTPSSGLYIQDPDSPSGSKVIIVKAYQGGTFFDTMDAVPEYSEGSEIAVARRHGFVFDQRPCPDPTCSGNMRWYEHEDGNIYEMCSNPDCDHDTGP